MVTKNTPELWNSGWANRKVSVEEDAYNLLKEENSIRFQRIEKKIAERFKSLKGLKAIEIGAGAGTNAALLAKRGLDITILDYSESALSRSREMFARNNLKAEFIYKNALNLSSDLLGKFDVSMSFGLSEHFTGEQRVQINKSHFDLLKKGGVAFISVPNSLNIPYRIHKLISEALGWWTVGEEYPFTRGELRDICHKIGVERYSFLGDSLWASLDFISPSRLVRKIFRIRPELFLGAIKPEKGSLLDEYLSYALVLCAFKD